MVPGETSALEAIWQVVAAIPRGRVSTYGAVALAAGLPGRARLAGYALRHAPDDLNLPWHRVLGAGGRIVFPASSSAYREQSRRLRAEGVGSGTAGWIARRYWTWKRCNTDWRTMRGSSRRKGLEGGMDDASRNL